MPNLHLVQPERLWYYPDFPFTRHLERHAHEIREEALALRVGDYEDWPERAAYSGAWKVFGLVARETDLLDWSHARNAVRCPRTADVVERVPGVLDARFSMLLPDTRVHPHADVLPGRLRCHLPLRTNPRATLRFDGLDVPWREGRCLVFDGTARHEAVNLGAEPRVILLLDLERDALEHAVRG
jgi:aspartyl/asparaginyl beta-hydroxylase (cupin superfamily)